VLLVIACLQLKCTNLIWGEGKVEENRGVKNRRRVCRHKLQLDVQNDYSQLGLFF
jgi:hypothetical protein